MDPKPTLREERTKLFFPSITAHTIFFINQVHNPTLCLDIAEACL